MDIQSLDSSVEGRSWSEAVSALSRKVLLQDNEMLRVVIALLGSSDPSILLTHKLCTRMRLEGDGMVREFWLESKGEDNEHRR